jgi:hypothetical protein
MVKKRKASTAGRTDPDLWERAKKAAIKKLGGRHSARAMQLAGQIYRAAGGGYYGPKTTAQKRLSKWTKEDWRTVTGEKARIVLPGGKVVYDRYLPAAAWKMLTAKQIADTRALKLVAKGQYTPNAPAAKKAGQKARRRK